MAKDFKIRCAKNFRELLSEIKLESIKRDIKVPSNQDITERIANKLKKEDILYDKFIKF